LYGSATHCNTHCTTLQHTATHTTAHYDTHKFVGFLLDGAGGGTPGWSGRGWGVGAREEDEEAEAAKRGAAERRAKLAALSVDANFAGNREASRVLLAALT